MLEPISPQFLLNATFSERSLESSGNKKESFLLKWAEKVKSCWGLIVTLLAVMACACSCSHGNGILLENSLLLLLWVPCSEGPKKVHLLSCIVRKWLQREMRGTAHSNSPTADGGAGGVIPTALWRSQEGSDVPVAKEGLLWAHSSWGLKKEEQAVGRQDLHSGPLGREGRGRVRILRWEGVGSLQGRSQSQHVASWEVRGVRLRLGHVGPWDQSSHSGMGSYQFKLGRGMMWSALDKDYF